MNRNYVYSNQHQASKGGFMPSYWSMVEICNDRTPETRGPGEDRVA